MNNIYILTSNSFPLAQFECEAVDMWYLFGKIKPIGSGKIAINKIFQATKNLNFKVVMSDWSQGYRCKLESENSSISCVLMECNSQQVSLRRIASKENIEWSKHNIQPLSISS